MIDLKPLHPEAVPAALEKAHRYRLLNEPIEAESICLDILDVDPGNRQARITLVLALSDQLRRQASGILDRARAAISHLAEEYDREYYSGVLAERQGKAHFHRAGPGSGEHAYESLTRAMEHFERAQELSPRWVRPGRQCAGGRDTPRGRARTRARSTSPRPNRAPRRPPGPPAPPSR